MKEGRKEKHKTKKEKKKKRKERKKEEWKEKHCNMIWIDSKWINQLHLKKLTQETIQTIAICLQWQW